MKEKPPVLSDEKFGEWCQSHQAECNFECGTMGTLQCRLLAQRDAGVAYYEPIIQQAKQDGYERGVKVEYETRQKAIQQAREEVAREIFEDVERLWPIPQRLKDKYLKE